MPLVKNMENKTSNYRPNVNSGSPISNIKVTASEITNVNVPNYTSSKTEMIDLVPVVNEEEEIEEFGGIGDFLGCVGDTVSGYWDGFKSLFTEKEDGKTKILNILEDCGATVSNVCTSAVEGVAKFGEAVVDTAALAGTGILSLGTVLVEGVMSIPDVIENGVSGFDFSFTEYMYDQTRNFIAKDHAGGFFDFYYNETDVGNWIKDNSYASETIRSVASGIGYAVGVIVLAMGTGGTSLAAESVTLAAPTAATMGMSAIAGGIGKGAETAYQSGADVQEGAEAALATGLWEGTQFYLGGKINGLSPFTSTAGNIGLRVGLDTIDGGAEGFVQPFISSIYEKGYYDENGNYIEFTDDYTFFDRYGEMWDDQGGWKQVGTQAAIGGIMSTGGELFGFLTRNGMNIRELGDVEKKIKTIPYDQLSDADKQIVDNARKQFGMLDSATPQEVIEQMNIIKNNLDFDKVEIKDMDLSTLKKLSDAVDGLDPKVQKDILSGITGTKNFFDIKNKGQLDYVMDIYLKNLSMEEIMKMNGSQKEFLNQYMLYDMSKYKADFDFSNIKTTEQLFDFYNKFKDLDATQPLKPLDIDLGPTQPLPPNYRPQDLDVTQPSMKKMSNDLDATQPLHPSYKPQDLDATQPLHPSYKPQDLDATQPLHPSYKPQDLNATQPSMKKISDDLDAKQPLTKIFNPDDFEMSKKIVDMSEAEISKSIDYEISKLDVNDPNYQSMVKLLREKEQLELQLRQKMTGIGDTQVSKSIDLLSESNQMRVREQAKKIFDKANALDDKITTTMLDLQGSDARLEGVDYRIKSLSSTEDKIARYMSNYGYSPDQAAREINDSLRYTLIVDPADYQDTVLSKLAKLKKQGYSIDYVNNAWDKASYKGLNVTMKSPDGVLIELQFHTESSFNVKQTLNHEFYEISRNTAVGPEITNISNRIQAINQQLYVDDIKFDYSTESSLDEAVAMHTIKSIDFSNVSGSEDAFKYAKERSTNSKMYDSFEDYILDTASRVSEWDAKLKSIKYVDPITGTPYVNPKNGDPYTLIDLVKGYISEDDRALGSYSLLNTINRATGNNPQEILKSLLKKNADNSLYMVNGKYVIPISHAYGIAEYCYDPSTGIVEGLGIGGADIKFCDLLTRVKSETDALNYALSLYNNPESLILGRGADINCLTRFGISEFDSAEQIYRKLTSDGKNLYYENGFLSCTPECGGGFMDDKKVNFIITTKEDVTIGNFSIYNKGEKEALMGAGTKFNVSTVKKDAAGKIYIYLEQI